MATITSKFDIDDVVFVKNSNGVAKGTVCAIGVDMSKAQKKSSSDFALIYLVWISDRRDNAGHPLLQTLGRDLRELQRTLPSTPHTDEFLGATTRPDTLLGWRAALDVDAMCRDAWRWQSMNPNGYEA